ncbi:TPA: VWA domain-containing protein [bacterium]|nr:VWA domain-containing protein [bacterium]
MKGPRLALIISAIIHGFMLLIFVNVHIQQEYRKASTSVSVDLSAQLPDQKFLIKRKMLEPVKREPVQKTEIDRPVKTVELTTSARIMRNPSDRNTPSLKPSMLPTDLSAPIGDTRLGDLSGKFKAREMQNPLRERRSQLVEFVDRMKGKRDIIYCLDISASMGAPGSNKLNLARSYLIESLLALTEKDSFNIVVFSKDIKIYNLSGTIQATKENIGNAINFLNQFTSQSVKSNTKTDLLSPILSALNMKPNIVVAVTDGLPTAGVIQPERILQSISDTNNLINAKIFAIGMEMDEEQPEAWLLKEIAKRNGGEFQLL